MMTFGKAKKSGSPKKAPIVAIPSKKKPMFMKEYDNKDKGKGPFAPLSRKRLSK